MGIKKKNKEIEESEKRIRGSTKTVEDFREDYRNMLRFYELPILEHEKD